MFFNILIYLDLTEVCADKQSVKWCKKNKKKCKKATVYEECKKTCNKCGDDPIDEACVDTKSAKFCNKQKKKGKCNSKKNKKSCKNTCGHC